MNKFLTYLLLILYTAVVHAQEDNPYIKAKAKTSSFEKKIEKYVTQLIITGKYKEALQHVKMNLSVLRLKSDELYLAYGLFGLGKLYTLINHYRKAEEALVECMTIREKKLGKSHPDYYAACMVLAELYIEMERFEEAEALIRASEKVDVSDIFVYKTLHLDFEGLLFQKTDRWEAAEQKFMESRALKTKAYGKEHPAYVDALVKLADLYIESGRFAEAENMLLEAINTTKYLRNKENVNFEDMMIFNLGFLEDDFREALFSLAKIYLEKGEVNKAEALYLQALQSVWKAFGTQHVLYANVLSALGRLYADNNQIDKGLKLQIEAWDILKKLVAESNSNCLNALQQLAYTYRLAGKIEAAAAHYAIYLKHIETHFSDFPNKYATALDLLGDFYVRIGDTKTAITYHVKSLAVNSNSLDQNYEVEDFLKKMNSLSFSNDAQALETFQHIFEIYEKEAIQTKDKIISQKAYNVLKAIMHFNQRVRSQFSEDANKIVLLASNAFYAQKGIEWALRLGKDAAEAFAFAEQNKSILLSNAIKADKARTMSDLPDSLALLEVRLQKELTLVKKQLLESENADVQAIFRQELIELDIKINQFKKTIETQYPKYYRQKYEPITCSLTDIQHLLAPKSLLLEYFVCDSITYLFAIRKADIKIHRLQITKTELFEKTKHFRKMLSDYTYILKNTEKAIREYTETAYWFYQSSLAPALEDIHNINHLIIVADDAFGHVPFEAFLTKPVSDKNMSLSEMPYLLKDYNISYSYGAQLWLENLQTTSKTKQGRLLAAAADYDVGTMPKHRAKNLQDLRSNLSQLPAAKEEVQKLSEIFEGTFLLDSTCVEKFFKENAHKYSLVHLAMHGILNNRHPILSSLAFTENGDSLEDNLLQAYEIAHLHLNADLVVLSACETGFGKFQQGEGVISLARSFMYAGVPSLVVSMWQVNDASTSLIMQSFYKNLAKGMDKAAALRQAKLEYIVGVGGRDAINGGDAINRVSTTHAHPAFWAPFIQLGNHKAIPLYRKGFIDNFWFWTSLGIALFITVFFGLRAWAKKPLV